MQILHYFIYLNGIYIGYHPLHGQIFKLYHLQLTKFIYQTLRLSSKISLI